MRTLIVCSLALALSTAVQGQSTELHRRPHTTRNLGIAISPELHQVGYWTLFSAVEGDGVDYNGDGDDTDVVAHVCNGRTQAVTNTGLAGSFLADGKRAILVASEPDQGADLNGDGDMTDQVIHVFDAVTGQLSNLGIQGENFSIGGSTVAYTVSESWGGVSLNGDPDTLDDVTFALHLDTLAVVNTRLAWEPVDREHAGGNFVIATREAFNRIDHNGDGDQADTVLFVYVADQGAAISTGRAVYVPGLTMFKSPRHNLGPNHLGFLGPEEINGRTDQNGDGDRDDDIVYILDLRSGVVTNTRLPGSSNGGLSVGGAVAFFDVSEAKHFGADLNGDGDAIDKVTHFHYLATGMTVNLKVGDDSPWPRAIAGLDRGYLFEGGVALLFHDPTQSWSLLGPADESVHLRDTFAPDGKLFFGSRWEPLHGDLNGDGDVDDTVLFAVPSTSNILVNLGIAAEAVLPGNGSSLAQVRESEQNRVDLNADGDTDDFVVHMIRHDTLEWINLGLAPGSYGYSGLASHGRWFAVGASERAQGHTDLNEDGDLNDFVLHVGRNNL